MATTTAASAATTASAITTTASATAATTTAAAAPQIVKPKRKYQPRMRLEFLLDNKFCIRVTFFKEVGKQDHKYAEVP